MSEQQSERANEPTGGPPNSDNQTDAHLLTRSHSSDFAVLLLGANLGDRQQTLRRATERLSAQVGPVTRQSRLYETAPWGITDQPSFLNQVLIVQTSLAPEAVLNQTQAIEHELGRVREVKWAARMIDIDILYYGQQVINTERLTVPHPYLHQRRFTLVPLAEVAPDFVHPVLEKTSLALLAECADHSEALPVVADPGSG